MRTAPRQEYARSPQGLWVRATVTPDQGVAVAAQERVVWDRGRWQQIDPDGTVQRSGDARTVRYGEEWADLGSFALPLRVLRTWVPVAWWDWLGYGLARHAAWMIALGWGETAAQVPTWFADLPAGRWIVPEATYRVRGPIPPGSWGDECIGAVLSEVQCTADAVTGQMRIRGVRIPWELPVPVGLGAFAVAMVPTLSDDAGSW